MEGQDSMYVGVFGGDVAVDDGLLLADLLEALIPISDLDVALGIRGEYVRS